MIGGGGGGRIAFEYTSGSVSSLLIACTVAGGFESSTNTLSRSGVGTIVLVDNARTAPVSSLYVNKVGTAVNTYGATWLGNQNDLFNNVYLNGITAVSGNIGTTVYVNGDASVVFNSSIAQASSVTLTAGSLALDSASKIITSGFGDGSTESTQVGGAHGGNGGNTGS